MQRPIKEYRFAGLVIHSAISCKPYSVGEYDLACLLMDRLTIPCVVIEATLIPGCTSRNRHVLGLRLFLRLWRVRKNNYHSFTVIEARLRLENRII